MVWNIKLLYTQNLAIFRSVTTKSIPDHLKLEVVDTKGKISPKQLKYLIRYCPNFKSIKFTYVPNDSDLKELSRYFSRQQINEQINDVANRNIYLNEIEEEEDLMNHNILS